MAEYLIQSETLENMANSARQYTNQTAAIPTEGLNDRYQTAWSLGLNRDSYCLAPYELFVGDVDDFFAYMHPFESQEFCLPDTYGTPSIGKYAFAAFKDTQIKLDDNVKIKRIVNKDGTNRERGLYGFSFIQDYAFYYQDLSELGTNGDGTLSGSYQKIGQYAFANTKLKHVRLGSDSVLGAYIRAYCFQGCSELEDVWINYGSSDPDARTFSDCDKLTNLTLKGSFDRVGIGLASGCATLQTVVLPSTVTYFSNDCFLKCPMLSSINIDAATNITYNAFNGCTSLTNLTLPASLKTCESYALNVGSSTNKATLTFLGETPPTITTSTMTLANIEAIKVPASAVDTYKAATNWSAFADLIVAIE